MSARLKMFAMAAAALALAACETTEGYQQRMDLWTGRLSDDLVIDWGAPESKERLSDGREVWSYFKSSVTETDGYYRDETRDVKRTFTDKDGKTRTETIQETFPVYVPPTTTRVECNTRFVIGQTSRVEQVSFNGNGCVAAPLD